MNPEMRWLIKDIKTALTGHSEWGLDKLKELELMLEEEDMELKECFGSHPFMETDERCHCGDESYCEEVTENNQDEVFE